MANEPAPAPPPVPQNPEHQTLVLTDPPQEKHHTLLYSLCVAAVALVTGGIVVAYWQLGSPAPETPAEVVQEEVATTTSQNNIDPKLIADLLDPTSYKYDLTLDGSVLADWVPDVDTLVKLDGWFYQDKNYIYSKNPHTRLLDRLTYADRETFMVFPGNNENSEWAKDKNHVYNFWEIVEGADPSTFKVFPPDNLYAISGTTLFYSTAQYLELYRSRKGVDPATFQLVSGQSTYDAQDKNHKYLQGEIVE